MECAPVGAQNWMPIDALLGGVLRAWSAMPHTAVFAAASFAPPVGYSPNHCG
jgi:hypothetical protein